MVCHMANEQANLIWIDCEMTGLSLEKDVLVEIAVLVTDSELNVIGDGVDVVIKASAEALADMNEFVTQMHTTSGLITEIPNGVSDQDILFQGKSGHLAVDPDQI